MNKKTYIYSVSSLLQIDTPYLCHIDLKISSLTAVTYCRLELQPVVTKIPKCDRGGCPWSPQQMTWTPRPSSQARKVSRVGRGTVQTSFQMITRGMNFCPILSGVHSVGHSIGSCGRSGPGRPWPASLWPGDGLG